MKAFLFVLLSLVVSMTAAAEQIDAKQSLIDVKCKSIFEHSETVRVSSSRQVDGDGLTTAMYLKVDRTDGKVWPLNSFYVNEALYDGPKREIRITATNLINEKMLLVIGLDTVADSDENVGYGVSDLSINGKYEDYLKFLCHASLGG